MYLSDSQPQLDEKEVEEKQKRNIEEINLLINNGNLRQSHILKLLLDDNILRISSYEIVYYDEVSGLFVHFVEIYPSVTFMTINELFEALALDIVDYSVIRKNHYQLAPIV